MDAPGPWQVGTCLTCDRTSGTLVCTSCQLAIIHGSLLLGGLAASEATPGPALAAASALGTKPDRGILDHDFTLASDEEGLAALKGDRSWYVRR